MSTAAESRPAAPPRSALRSVALPTEHGGWGLTSEPGLLGLLVAPSLAGLCIALAAMVAFIARTPVRIVLVDGRRHRLLGRTRLAFRVALIELAVLAGLLVGAFTLTEHRFWIPAVVAAPLLAVELWYDTRSRSRRLIPELSGAVAVASVAAMVALAGGASGELATGLWLVLAARAVSSIPAVRAQIQRARGRVPQAGMLAVADGVAIAAALGAVMLDGTFLIGAFGVVIVVTAQRLFAHGTVPAPKIIGLRQMALGYGLVAVTALGVAVL
jgi:YwiC-like protein